MIKTWPVQFDPEKKIYGQNPTEEHCYFFSTRWIQKYVSEWARENFLGKFQFISGNQTVFAFVSRCSKLSRIGIPYTSIGFNESSEPDLESLTLEFNDFLVLDPPVNPPLNKARNFAPSFEKFLSTVRSEVWDELRISALAKADAESATFIASQNGLIVLKQSERFTYSVRLDRLREAEDQTYLSSRSANTRSQLRKALRETEAALGLCKVEIACSLNEALDWMKRLADLHTARWKPKNKFEGFNNSRFYNFHEQQITQLWKTGEVHIIRVTAGETVLAYLYNFYVAGRAYFNMSGIDYTLVDARKPGLIAHWLSIEYYLKSNASVYDFLAGTNQYKESLCTDKTVQISLLIRRKRWYFQIEQMLRAIKTKPARSKI